MAVIVIPKFTKADITKMLGERRKRIDRAILSALQRVGEQFIIDARNTESYNDVTGNLRSSIGYVILKNGKQINQGFPGKSNTGRNKAKEVIDEISAKRQSGYVLIVVAGMDYAAAVEARGFDVLTNSSIKATNSLRKSLADLQRKIEKIAA